LNAARFDQDQSAAGASAPSCFAKQRGGAMSKGEMIVLAGIVGAFVLFALGLAWVDFTTHRG
jgi:hypothetical protein